MRSFPGINAPARTDLPVMHSHAALYRAPSRIGFSEWLAAIPLWVFCLASVSLVLWPLMAGAQAIGTDDLPQGPLVSLWRWVPFILFQGFVFTLIISFLTMVVGTFLGVFLGLGQLSPIKPLSWVSMVITQIFRNSPWLVLLFIVMLSFPFEFEVAGMIIPVPDWAKAVIGLALPVMANISEIVRGAVNSVPTGQWEAAESLAFSRRQTLFQIILPQCIKRMIPPWMNWYAILTMATPIVSILGVEEVLNLTRQAIEAENNRPELLVPFYGFVLLIFFLYCYPIALLTVRLEKRFVLKL